jgi:hypothetical protein
MLHKVRRTQAVVPFGVGAIVDFRREALMAAGLHAWPAGATGRVDDPRLARRLGVDHFREPPSTEERRPDMALPFVRFPLWHKCPSCEGLELARADDRDSPKCSSTVAPYPDRKPCSEFRYPPRMVQLRFVIACEDGHIEDFPWIAWVHSEGGPLRRTNTCRNPLMKLTSTGRAGLDGLVVICLSCERRRSLAMAGGPDALATLGCAGNRPWLGPGGAESEPCRRTMRVVQRGATNIYFANVESSILIPPYASRARRIIEESSNWTYLNDESLGPLDVRLRGFAHVKRVDLEDLRKAYHDKLAAMERPEEVARAEHDFRYSEFKAILDRARPVHDDLRLVHRQRSEYEPRFAEYFKDVVLIEKLAETRALTGFSRIVPEMTGGGSSPKLDQLSLDTRQRWLPAVRVYGEGIFLVVDPERLARWASQDRGRLRSLSERYRDAAASRGRTVPLPPASYFVLHTLAHVLIRRLSFECGYGSSSLRERIYSREVDGVPMTGILIYTAAGDCEGTMGGLVRQGRPGRLEPLLSAALEDARWCSADPLCSESHGQGTDSLNLAACHACALLPETSCEMGNRLLDRRCLVGGLAGEDEGFFAGL